MILVILVATYCIFNDKYSRVEMNVYALFSTKKACENMF